MEMLTNNTDTILIKSTELLKSQLRFIGTMQQIFGVVNIVLGAISCLGIITAIVGIPVIINGVKLFQSGSAFSLAAALGRGEDFTEAIRNLHGYWKYVLIGIICTVILFFIYFLIIFSIIASIANH